MNEIGSAQCMDGVMSVICPQRAEMGPCNDMWRNKVYMGSAVALGRKIRLTGRFYWLIGRVWRILFMKYHDCVEFPNWLRTFEVEFILGSLTRQCNNNI